LGYSAEVQEKSVRIFKLYFCIDLMIPTSKDIKYLSALNAKCIPHTWNGENNKIIGCGKIASTFVFKINCLANATYFKVNVGFPNI